MGGDGWKEKEGRGKRKAAFEVTLGTKGKSAALPVQRGPITDAR